MLVDTKVDSLPIYKIEPKNLSPVEIEETIFALAGQPFDAEEFSFAFLELFGNKDITVKRLSNYLKGMGSIQIFS